MQPDIAEFENQLAAVNTEVRNLVEALTEAQGTATPPDGSPQGTWSVARCLEHVVLTNRAYLANMRSAAETARAKRKMRRSPAKPGFVGRIFVGLLEPPVKAGRKIKAPKIIQPPATITLADASQDFLASQQEIQIFLQANADLDLARIAYRNPFVPGPRFSLATGLSTLLAHERRHLWQAQQVLQSVLEAQNHQDQ
jgi:hypothetical protein